jgi:DHA1 family bicyclomycin/chloramphenicol resistance-like MFS transporter
VLSPLLSGTGLHLAIGTAVFALLGWVFWRWEMHRGQRVPEPTADAAALEPAEGL